MIGEPVKRLEDPVLLRGTGRFAADIRHDGQLHMRVVRSPVAHGRLNAVRAAAARALAGIVAVWTAADVADLPPIDFRLSALEEMKAYRQPVLARDRVRYVGEPLAVIFAESGYLAEDAAELVDIDIEPWPAILDTTREPVPWLTSAETVWADPDALGQERSSECASVHLEYGDVEAAFAEADHVVEVETYVGRHSGVPLECRGASAHLEPATGLLVIDGAAKVPFWNRDAIARMVGRAPQDVHLREGHVGGGFGPRGELYPEDVLVALAAIRLRRPITWTEDRQENLVATNHSRDQRHVLRAAVRQDGFVTALDGRFWTDQGAYVRTHAATVSGLTASMLPGPYVVPSFRVTGHIRMSNKTPAGTYRSPGRYEGTFARERLMDKIAARLGLDRQEVRRRNFVPAEQMPFRRPILAMGTELVYDSGDYALLMDKMEKTFKIKALERSVARRRKAGELVGIGYGWFVEKSGLGPYEGVSVAVDTAGHVQITSGVSSVGQGVDTVLAQVVAGTLDVDIDVVRSVRGRTDQFGYGRGAFATRQSVMAGSASLRAAELVREKAFAVAAHEWEIDPTDLELSGGHIRVKGDPSRSLSLARIAFLLEPGNAQRLGMPPGLTAEGWFYTDHMTYPYGCHVAVVRIDRGTGGPTVERYLVGYDVGKALNRQLVDGQIVGGVAQGLGGALLEEFTYSAEGQPQSSTFMDYLIPTVAEMPPVELLVTEDAPSPLNPLGVKGAGEGGTTGAAAALAGAIDDALGALMTVTRTPVRPDQVRAHLRSREAGQ